MTRRRTATRTTTRTTARTTADTGGPGLVLGLLQLASIAYLSAVAGLLWWSNAPVLVGWQPKVVLTGSMLPVIRPGDVALIGPGDAHDAGLPPGRIALVTDPTRESGTYLHRVVRYEDDGRLVTKGDANPSEDHPAVDPDRVRGQLRLLVPLAGSPVVWLHDRRLGLLGGLVVASWVALAVAMTIRLGSDDADDPDDADDADGGQAAAKDRQRAADAAPAAGGLTVLPGVAPTAPEVPLPEPAAARPARARPAAARQAAVPPAARPAPARLSAEAERLVVDLDAFEAAFGPAFGAEDGEDVSDFDGRGFDR